MGKHETAYPRIERDFYPTPRLPVEALLEHIDIRGLRILEAACGAGDMAEVLKEAGAVVCATDIEDRRYSGLNYLTDFTTSTLDLLDSGGSFDGVVTNPPLGRRGELGVAFIQVGLIRMGEGGFLALLLPSDFDSAKSRRFLFGNCSRIACKITLTKRVKWFDIVGHNKSPKENHAWFLWGKPPFRRDEASRRPVIRYAPTF